MLVYRVSSAAVREQIVRVIEESLTVENCPEIHGNHRAALTLFRQRSRMDRIDAIRNFLEEYL